MRPLKQLAKLLISVISLAGIGYGSTESSSSQLLVNVKSEAVLSQHARIAEHILEFAHVSWPGVASYQSLRLPRESEGRL